MQIFGCFGYLFVDKLTKEKCLDGLEISKFIFDVVVYVVMVLKAVVTISKGTIVETYNVK